MTRGGRGVAAVLRSRSARCMVFFFPSFLQRWLGNPCGGCLANAVLSGGGDSARQGAKDEKMNRSGLALVFFIFYFYFYLIYSSLWAKSSLLTFGRCNKSQKARQGKSRYSVFSVCGGKGFYYESGRQRGWFLLSAPKSIQVGRYPPPPQKKKHPFLFLG
jgi:hypothetical protein